ncbi:MBL fold metallo-hydrolase [Leifsonia sp. F6_8S_P_1B]|uniref:MBL fold metallo-hydrolase n=1 Tax=Leifsonia williamsii TaxID=3035919 RepID=A0ABT8K9H0_9MICO|nr:MBL fold metallo-hydrolase [Leifsonia williamsii]MDN4613687.1 MBL fold metallo-hydrolase [Leifsonia williamsii]
MQVGAIRLDPVSDGAFVARPSYFHPDATAAAEPRLFGRAGAAWLPIGCFLVRTGDRVILVDAGLGPDMQSLPDAMWLVGGQLLTGLRSLGVRPGDITDVICTHFHADHVGWLFDLAAQPVFPAATVWFGAGDWDHFVDGPGEMAPHIEKGLRSLPAPRLRSLRTATEVVPGVEAVPAPGHTPGHLCVVLESDGRRVILLGDAITAPEQLAESGWHSMGDVDARLAEHTRSTLCELLADPSTTGVGAHFPELRFGTLHGGRWHPTDG